MVFMSSIDNKHHANLIDSQLRASVNSYKSKKKTTLIINNKTDSKTSYKYTIDNIATISLGFRLNFDNEIQHIVSDNYIQKILTGLLSNCIYENSLNSKCKAFCNINRIGNSTILVVNCQGEIIDIKSFIFKFIESISNYKFEDFDQLEIDNNLDKTDKVGNAEVNDWHSSLFKKLNSSKNIKIGNYFDATAIVEQDIDTEKLFKILKKNICLDNLYVASIGRENISKYIWSHYE